MSVETEDSFVMVGLDSRVTTTEDMPSSYRDEVTRLVKKRNRAVIYLLVRNLFYQLLHVAATLGFFLALFYGILHGYLLTALVATYCVGMMLVCIWLEEKTFHKRVENEETCFRLDLEIVNQLCISEELQQKLDRQIRLQHLEIHMKEKL